MVGTGDEPVLDCPAFARERRHLVGAHIAFEHLVDREIAHRVGGHPPTLLGQANHDFVERLLRHRPEPVERPSLSPGFLVRLAHQAALESPVHAQLHSAEA